MAMGRRKTERQESLFVTADNLPRSQGHPFYKALNALLAEANFDRWIEDRCQPYYDQDESRGQRSIPPASISACCSSGTSRRSTAKEASPGRRGRLVREVLPDSDTVIQRAAPRRSSRPCRCADSLSLRSFLSIPLDKNSPDHSTLSLTRRRLPPEVFDEVFQFVLKIAADKKLLSGQTMGVDSTTLEANAAMNRHGRVVRGTDRSFHVAA